MTPPTGSETEFDLDHVEMYVTDLDARVDHWTTRYGLVETAHAGSPDDGFRSVLLERGDIRLVLTEAISDTHPAAAFVMRHGDGVATIALRTPDVDSAYSRAVAAGARPVIAPVPSDSRGVVAHAAVLAFGDVQHALLQRTSADQTLPVGFRPGPRATGRQPEPDQAGRYDFLAVDHFAVCVGVGELDPLVQVYVDGFGFEQTFEERIQVGGQAMLSRVVQSRSRTVTLTLIQPDPAADPGQIDEFLKNHDGSGVQHVALSVDDVVEAVQGLEGLGIEFLSSPDAYYTRLPSRVAPPRHAVDRLRQLNVLVDEDHGGQLFQIFTRSTHERRTLFFEVIERCGAKTFGSSNVKALYEAVESERSVDPSAPMR